MTNDRVKTDVLLVWKFTASMVTIIWCDFLSFLKHTSQDDAPCTMFWTTGDFAVQHSHFCDDFLTMAQMHQMQRKVTEHLVKAILHPKPWSQWDWILWIWDLGSTLQLRTRCSSFFSGCGRGVDHAQRDGQSQDFRLGLLHRNNWCWVGMFNPLDIERSFRWLSRKFIGRTLFTIPSSLNLVTSPDLIRCSSNVGPRGNRRVAHLRPVSLRQTGPERDSTCGKPWPKHPDLAPTSWIDGFFQCFYGFSMLFWHSETPSQIEEFWLLAHWWSNLSVGFLFHPHLAQIEPVLHGVESPIGWPNAKLVERIIKKSRKKPWNGSSWWVRWGHVALLDVAVDELPGRTPPWKGLLCIGDDR